MSDPRADEPILLTVEARAHGWRVDHYLTRLYPNHSRALFQKAIQQGQVLVNGLPVKMARRLRVNDRVSVRLPVADEPVLAAEDIPLDILFEDEHLVVINKQAGRIVHPGKGNYGGTIAAALQFHFDQLSDLAGKHRPGIVHRLDRDTSGVLVVAKNNQVHHLLSRQFERRDVSKEYRALVWGEVELDRDVIDTHMRVNPRRREKMCVCEPGGNARRAVTSYEVLERFDGFTSLRLLPRTGRTHQLRVHMQHLKHPIVADRLYGGRSELTRADLQAPRAGSGSRDPGESQDVLIARQALHAFRLGFRHPESGQPLEFEAPLPTDFVTALDAIRALRGKPDGARPL